MQKPGDLAERVEREIAASSTTSTTRPGQTERTRDPALIEAINQVFALFRLNYHNQYYAAFSEAEQLRQIKKLWLESLGDLPAVLILQGAKRAIETSEYLPTLHRMRSCCESGLADLGFPDARDAYFEACNAGNPPEAQRWSHAVVYWCGRDVGWRMLAEAPEPQSWPLFRRRYEERCCAVLTGNEEEPVPAPAENQLHIKPLSADEAAERIARLRRDNDLETLSG